jgi:rsbT co-antagonist protein RsbR
LAYDPPQLARREEDAVVDEPGDTSRLATLLRDNSDDLIDRWVRLAAPALRGRITEAELAREVRGLYAAITPILADTSIDADTSEIKALLSELSASRARQGFTPTETATSVFALKQAVFELTEQNTDPALFQDLLALSRVLDMLGLWTFETYSRAREDIIREQSEQLLELTTPVIKLWDGVLAVPLVGTLDSARTQVVMEKLLESLVETGSEHAIIDITGVLAVDTQVAQHLLKTVAAARLMGADCTISGIRPQIAQTIVALGIDLGDIATKASLADALLHAFRRSGVDVVRRSGRDG